MERGYVKMWRKSLHNDWLKNHGLWVVWSYCLMKASHKKRTSKIGFQEIEINPGQFIFGRKKASEELNMSESKIRRCIESLRKSGNITIKTTNKFSIITIVNWHIYQSGKSENDQQTTNKRPTNDQQTTTDKNVKNVKNEKQTIEFPAYLNLDLWKEFKKYRTKIKAPLTHHAEKLALTKLEEVRNQGFDADDIINQTIECGWKSFFPVKNKQPKGNKNGTSKYDGIGKTLHSE